MENAGKVKKVRLSATVPSHIKIFLEDYALYKQVNEDKSYSMARVVNEALEQFYKNNIDAPTLKVSYKRK